MSPLDLAAVMPGLLDAPLESQAAFRGALQALSRPGTLVACEHASYTLGLALLDQDTRVWLSPSAQRLATSLRFHTGCVLVTEPGHADFVFAGVAEEMPPLASFAEGSDDAPHRSATVILEVTALSSEGGWTLTGPGVHGRALLRAGGLGADFLTQWTANHKRFPRGIDLFLCSGDRFCGLPRTTRLEV